MIKKRLKDKKYCHVEKLPRYVNGGKIWQFFLLELALNSDDELDAKTAQVWTATRYRYMHILDTVGYKIQIRKP